MLNKMLVIGNVGRDPEMRYTPSGSAVTSFSLAVSRRYTPPNGEPQEETEWFDITAWNRLAETCNNYVTRGMKVYVEGRLRSRSWVGQDGQTRFRNEIVANTVTFLNRPQGGGGYGGSPQGEQGGYGGGGGGYGADGDYYGGPAEPSDADDLPW
ncbi:MAG: single-stranded DNA-binding protein [Chloroflexi bacterium]|nr:single-stranded DNA-binding protein [Chloroflexota bacterium]